ncbi:hypothetical protein AVL48_25125 [Amycolatopsis regifaucium]|uniref:DUF1996 domain-containing protein n=2 Tax=Amycolatopsis regifaucium TaxID=546365 RepID=A0A154MRX2_9PSEU|nr:hypothetical protein AVL48_25125 [Amycolatopsis regifaucium]OKA09651.1 hypothetical protein ATP06_0207680 [Amycolatopsis regifaucium]
MPRNPRSAGRHRMARRTKLATGAIALSLAIGGLVVVNTTGIPDSARADGADKSFFIDIAKVPRGNNVNLDLANRGARGTFTVDCGRNENGHFNGDNFIAQPGVRNGAEHLHDYVGNLSTNADSNNKSLLRAGTTCKNGDKSAYFWPVIRINTEEEEENEAANEEKLAADRANAAKDEASPQADCPDVASELEDVPDQAMDAVNEGLIKIDQDVDNANNQLAQGKQAAKVLDDLKNQRQAAIKKIADQMKQAGKPVAKPEDQLTGCAVKQNGEGGLDNGGENSKVAKGGDVEKKKSDGKAAELPGVDDNNEIGDNEGEIQRPAKVDLTFTSGGARRVVAMPKFLRVLYGDAKQSTNGPANARPSWTCSGFEDRLTELYPICPQGSKVTRVHSFPNCWDGKNTDSANHRTHIVFSDRDGKCPRGFKNVPQLRITLTYDIPPEVQAAGQYAVDAFAQEKHNPRSDHDDFANVMSQCLMNQLVKCVNSGKRCRQ